MFFLVLGERTQEYRMNYVHARIIKCVQRRTRKGKKCGAGKFFPIRADFAVGLAGVESVPALHYTLICTDMQIHGQAVLAHT